MVLDIRYHNKPPDQVQKVRLVTIYTTPAGKIEPEVVIHFENGGQHNELLSGIKEIKVWND